MAAHRTLGSTVAGLVQENVDAQVDAASEGQVPRVLRTGASVSVDVVLSRGVMEALPQPPPSLPSPTGRGEWSSKLQIMFWT